MARVREERMCGRGAPGQRPEEGREGRGAAAADVGLPPADAWRGRQQGRRGGDWTGRGAKRLSQTSGGGAGIAHA